MHWAKSARLRNPSLESLSKLSCTSFHASTPFDLLLINFRPRSALCAPERVRSSCARCLLRARAASAVSNPPPAPLGAEEDESAREAWLWLHENRRSSDFSSCENCLALATASAFSSCENCRKPRDELRRIVGDRDTDAGVSYPLPATPSSMLITEAGSTLRRTMVSSSWRSSVTSTNSSAAELESVPGEVPALTVALPGTVSDAHRRSCLAIPLIDQK